MENATDALIMAGSVFLLILALTVSISSFTTLRVQADAIVNEKEQLLLAKDPNGYIQYINANKDDVDKDIRKVNVETLVTALRRLRKEQYTMYVCLKDVTLAVNGNDNPINSVIMTDVTSEKIKQKFPGVNQVIKFTLAGEGWKYINDERIIAELYNKLKAKTFKEYTGVYKNATDASDVEKEAYKILTFVQQ